ncbi:MAG: flavin reductase family protein [Candidatus Aenigmarchaeota archaeon]|nr:flavin reductase family protein [Candidatus Aenigmarchaeota archaeon]
MRVSQQIFPRAVALIVTISKDGEPNVMTASFLMPISFEPKYLAFSITPTRHTFKNLKEVKEFTFNICDESMLEEAKICGSYSGRDTDKFKLAKLEKESSSQVKPPLLKKSPVSFECRVEGMKEFGDHWLVVGRVLKEHVREEEFIPLLHKSGDIFPRLK